jgi:hypothetical protein
MTKHVAIILGDPDPAGDHFGKALPETSAEGTNVARIISPRHTLFAYAPETFIDRSDLHQDSPTPVS